MAPTAPATDRVRLAALGWALGLLAGCLGGGATYAVDVVSSYDPSLSNRYCSVDHPLGGPAPGADVRLAIGRSGRPGRTLDATGEGAKEPSPGAGSAGVVDLAEGARVSFAPEALVVHFRLRLGADGASDFTLTGPSGLQLEQYQVAGAPDPPVAASGGGCEDLSYGGGWYASEVAPAVRLEPRWRLVVRFGFQPAA